VDATIQASSPSLPPQEIESRAQSASPGSWIVGAGWDDAKYADHRYVTRADLDRVSGDHPVLPHSRERQSGGRQFGCLEIDGTEARHSRPFRRP